MTDQVAGLLAEQARYYRERSGEFEDWWFRHRRYDRGTDTTRDGSHHLAGGGDDVLDHDDTLAVDLDALSQPAGAVDLGLLAHERGRQPTDLREHRGAAGFTDVSLDRDDGLAVFSAARP